MANAKISKNFVRESFLDIWQIGRHSFGHVFDLSELSRLRKKFVECVHACDIVHQISNILYSDKNTTIWLPQLTNLGCCQRQRAANLLLVTE